MQALGNGTAPGANRAAVNGSAAAQLSINPSADLTSAEATTEEGYGSSDSEGEEGATARGEEVAEPRDVADGGVTLHGLIRRMAKLADDRCACGSLALLTFQPSSVSASVPRS